MIWFNEFYYIIESNIYIFNYIIIFCFPLVTNKQLFPKLLIVEVTPPAGCSSPVAASSASSPPGPVLLGPLDLFCVRILVSLSVKIKKQTCRSRAHFNYLIEILLILQTQTRLMNCVTITIKLLAGTKS